ncbi:MAG: HEAT repeat domain-containing protein [Planctomycetota bacterium]
MDVREQLDKLRSPDAAVRARAATRLGEMGERAVPAIPLLIDSLRDDALFTKEPIDPAWMSRPRVGDKAAAALAKIGKPAIEPLRLAQKDDDWRVRNRVIHALRQIKDAGVVEPLIAALKDETEGNRREAAAALADIKDFRRVEPLIEVLKNKDDDERLVRSFAATALETVTDPRAIAPLRAALDEVAEDARDSITDALARLGDPQVVTSSIAALKDENLAIRQRAAYLLMEAKDPQAVEPLIAALDDDEPDMRRFVARALGAIADPRAVEPLIELLDQGEYSDISSTKEPIMREQRRFGLAGVLALSGVVTVAVSNAPAADAKAEPAVPAGLIPLKLGEPIRVSVASTPVKLNQRDVHLLSLNKIEFELDKESRLKAKIGTVELWAGLTKLPHVIDYRVHVAIFDEKGRLLGTGSMPHGVHPHSISSLPRTHTDSSSMDFGISLNYAKAKFFALVISERDLSVIDKPGKE